MDASRALADLTEISAQIEAAVIAERSGEVVATTIQDEERGKRFARAAADLLKEAEGDPELGPLVQLEAVLGDGSVFVVREGDRLIAAATGADPTVGLVFYDLKSCLRSAGQTAEEPPEAPPAAEAPKRTRKKKDDEGTSDAEA